MYRHSSHPRQWAWLSPWVIIGSVCILAGILLILALKNIDRERDFMERALLSQANVLIRSLEAGSRTGMMGMGWGRRQLQLLMEETAQQQDVLYVAVTTSAGRIILHSEPARVGHTALIPVPQTGRTIHRFVEEGRKSFEVIRNYQPWFRQRGRASSQGNACSIMGLDGSDKDLFIIVGMDPTPFEDAQRQDISQTILVFGIMFLVGAAGFLSLFWAQNYRSARCSLQDIRAFTSTILNQMPVGLIATDLNGDIQTTNEAAQRILRSPIPSGAIDRLPCFVPIATRLKKEETVIEQEVQCRIDGAGSVPLLVNAAVIRDGERRTAGHLFLLSDMTNIKQLEEQLRRSERLASLGRLAAGIAHEIRNPLSSVKGFATILAGRFKEDERSRKITEVMIQEVERLDRVVTELLDYARPTELHRKAYSCTDLIRHTLGLVEGDAATQRVRVEASVEPEDLQAEVDPDRFAQVLLNLYLNALQAMEEGGTLEVRAFQQENNVVLTVADTGTGISPEHIPHIFDPYYTTKPRGVGLGLANVHKLVEAHRGEIEVTSSPGQGTHFTIRVPLEKSQPEQGDALKESRSISGRTKADAHPATT